jgi:hypothetical protein
MPEDPGIYWYQPPGKTEPELLRLKRMDVLLNPGDPMQLFTSELVGIREDSTLVKIKELRGLWFGPMLSPME